MARKMKDSGIEWIGEIPEGWEVTRLKYLADFEPTCDTSYLTDESKITYTPMECVKNGGFENRSALYGNLSHTLTPFQNGDIAMAKVTPCFENGNIAIMNNLFSGFGLGSSELFIFRPKSISTRYFFYWLQNKAFVARACSTMTGTGGLKRISPSFIRNCPVHYPSTDEQTKISDYLDAKCSEIDVMLSKTRSSIEEYKKLKQAVITQAVTKGVRGEREMKDSGIDYIGQIPAKWVLGKLRNVGDTQNGISKSSEFFGKGFPFVSYSDVYKNYSLPFAVSGLVESTPEEQERYSVKEGDIFFTRTSETIEEVGFSCVCEKDIPNATFAGFLIRVRPFSDRLYTPYAKYYFRSAHLRFYLVKEMNLVTRASLGQSLLKSMPVLLPPLEEQKEIANYLDAKCAEIDRLIAKKEQLVKELENYKKSLIFEYVTGKKELRR